MKKLITILILTIMTLPVFSQVVKLTNGEPAYIPNYLILEGSLYFYDGTNYTNLGDTALMKSDSTYLYYTQRQIDSIFNESDSWTPVVGGIEYPGGNILVSDGKIIGDTLDFITGEALTWNVAKRTLNIPTGSGSIIQAGRELQIDVYNNSGVNIGNAKAVYPNGSFNGTATIGLAQSNSHETIGLDYGLTTVSIDDGNYGDVTWFGETTANTSTYNLGDTLYISATSEGELVNTMPSFPNYAIQIGIVMKIGTDDGIIFVTGRSTVDDTFINFWNCTFREKFDFRVSESGGVITGTLSPSNGHPNMTMKFSDGLTTLDTDPALTIILTAGTDINPQFNYVYIPQSTKVLTLSTSEFPTTEPFIYIAKLYLQSATTTGTYDALINQNINNEIQGSDVDQGFLSILAETVRYGIGAKWRTGVEGSCTIVDASTPDDVFISTTAGVIRQMHDQSFLAKNTQTGDVLRIVNHPTTPYIPVSNLNTQLLDASGNSINSTSLSIVVWGAANKTGETSHLMANLPTSTYSFISPDDAVEDGSNYSVYDIPSQFQGTGFLIARFTYTYKNDVWVLYDTENLRGKVPNTIAGGGGGGGGATSYSGLDDTPSTLTAKALQVVNAGGTALENTVGLSYDNVNERLGIGISTPLSALHIDNGTGIANGLNLGSTLGNGFSLCGTDAVSGFAGNKEIFRLVENVTEQFIINPQGDLTGTAAAPSLAFGGGGVFNTGIYEPIDNYMYFQANGSGSFAISELSVQSIKILPIANGIHDLGSSTRVWDQLWIENIENTTDIHIIINSIEAMRLTEDSIFADSVIVANSGIRFPDGNIQTVAYQGSSTTGVMQVAKAEILYTNTSQTTIVVLPANSVVWDIRWDVWTIFNDSGTDNLKIGTNSIDNKYIDNDNELIISGWSTSSTGNTPDTIIGSTNVTFTYTGQNSDATTGQAFVYIHYTIH